MWKYYVRMYQTVVVKRELSQKSKHPIYQSIYVPPLTYGHKVWVVTEKNEIVDTSSWNYFPLYGVSAQP